MEIESKFFEIISRNKEGEIKINEDYNIYFELEDKEINCRLGYWFKECVDFFVDEILKWENLEEYEWVDLSFHVYSNGNKYSMGCSYRCGSRDSNNITEDSFPHDDEIDESCVDGPEIMELLEKIK